MFELTMNGKTYQFRFGMGFLRNINSRVKAPVDGIPGEKKNIGMKYKLSGLFDRDLEDLCEILIAANSGLEPRMTVQDFDAYIEDECQDVEGLFQRVIDFLLTANVCKTTMEALQKVAEMQQAKLEAEMKK